MGGEACVPTTGWSAAKSSPTTTAGCCATAKARSPVTDGPYAESKEVVGGFFIIAAKDYEEACKIAQGCPHLKHYGRVEVRQIDKMG